MIEVRNNPQGKQEEVEVQYNFLIFLLKGKMRFSFRNYKEIESDQGYFMFVPLGSTLKSLALEDSEMLIIRMHEYVYFCESFGIKQLYLEGVDRKPAFQNKPVMLEIMDPIYHYIDGLSAFFSIGLRCRYYFDIKLKELFVLLMMHYSNDQLRDLFRMILCVDPAFVEAVRSRYMNYTTAQEFAEAMNYSLSGFSKKFRSVFGQPVYQWMKEQKAKAIYHEICCGKKTLQQLAFDFGFSNSSQFNDFCKANYESTPGKLRKNPISGVEL